jgi:hypothetical protein
MAITPSFLRHFAMSPLAVPPDLGPSVTTVGKTTPGLHEGSPQDRSQLEAVANSYD